MEYRQLGSAGLRVSVVGLGGNTFGRYCDEAATARVVERALELGVNHIDTADIYSHGVSEEYVGRAIAGRRDQVVVATKVGNSFGEGPHAAGLSLARVVRSCELSLRRLGTDYVDLYYLHTPDRFTPLEETLGAFDQLVRQGKVRYVGISNHAAWQIADALAICDRRGYAPPVVSQSPYSLLDRRIESELVPFCQAHHLGIVPSAARPGLAGDALGVRRGPASEPAVGLALGRLTAHLCAKR